MIPTDALLIIVWLLLIVALFVAAKLHYYRRCPVCNGTMRRRAKGRVLWRCVDTACGYVEYRGDIDD